MAGAIGYATVQLIPSFEGLEKAASGPLDRAMTPAAESAGRKSGGIFGNGFMTTVAHVMVAAGLYQIGQSIAHGIGQGIATGLKTASFMQEAQISFETLLGSGGKAEQMLTGLSKFAAKTPFELTGTVQATQQLLGAGAAAKDVIPTLTALGDTEAAMGGSQDQLSHTMLAWTQIMTRGKLDTQDLLQISNSGIPIWKELAKAVHKPVGSIQDLVASGKLAADTTLPKLQAQLEKDYGGSMAKQAKTLAGVWSTVKDVISQSLGKAFMPLAPILARTLPGAADATGKAILGMSKGIGSTVKFFGKIGDTLKSAFGPTLGIAFQSIGNALKPLGDLLVTVFKSFTPDLARIAPAVSPLSLAFKAIVPSLTPLAQMFSDLATNLIPVLVPLFDEFARVAGQIVGVFSQVGAVLSGALTSALQQFAPMFGQAAQAVGELLQPLYQVITTILPDLIALITGPAMGAFRMLVNTGLKLAVSLFKQLMPVVVQVIHALMPLAATIMTTLGPALMQIVRSLLPPLMALFRAYVPIVLQVASVFGKVAVILAQTLIPIVKALIPVFTVVIKAVVAAVKPLITILQGVIEFVTGVLTGNWKMAWQGIRKVLEGAWKFILAVLKGAWDILKSLFTAGLKIVASLWTAGWKILGVALKAAWGLLKGIVRGGLTAVVGILRGIGGFVKDALKGAGSWLVSAGRNIVQGLMHGISSLASTVGHFFLNLLPGWIRKPFEAALGIHSPSRVFFAYGVNIVQGLVNGISAMAGAATARSKKLADALTKPVADAIGKIGQGPASPAFDVATVGITRINAQIKTAATALQTAIKRGLSAVDARPLAAKIMAAAKLAQSQLKNLRAKINTTDLKAISKSLTGSVEDMQSAFSQIITDMKRAGVASQIIKAMTVQEKALTTAMTAQAAVTDKLSTAQDNLNALMDSYHQQVDSVTSSIQDYANITTMGALGDGGAVSLQTMIDQYTQAAASAQTFATDIATLKGRGLNSGIINQLVSAGPGQAMQQVQALMTASAAQIGQINTVAGQVLATGNQLGTTSADNMYAAGIKAAQRLVDGLKSQQDGLVKTIATLSKGTQVLTEKGMQTQGVKAAEGLIKGLQSKQGSLISAITAIGKSMINAFKAQFKIHSPSRLMADEIGAPIVQGIAQGMLASTGDLTDAANHVSPYAVPPLPSQPVGGSASASSDGTLVGALLAEVRALKTAVITASASNADAIGQSLEDTERTRLVHLRAGYGNHGL